MAVVDASVYVALIHADQAGHEESWVWLRQVQSRQEPLRAPVILAAEWLARSVAVPILSWPTRSSNRSSP